MNSRRTIGLLVGLVLFLSVSLTVQAGQQVPPRANVRYPSTALRFVTYDWGVRGAFGIKGAHLPFQVVDTVGGFWACVYSDRIVAYVGGYVPTCADRIIGDMLRIEQGPTYQSALFVVTFDLDDPNWVPPANTNVQFEYDPGDWGTLTFYLPTLKR